MSQLTSELPKEVAITWRKHLGTTYGQLGIDWLRRNYSRTDGETDLQMVRNAARFEGYMRALDDIEDTLTALPQKLQTIDEPPLETADPR